MPHPIYRYGKKMDFDVTVLEYRFNDVLKSSLADKLPFEMEDSNFAPEPSVAVGIQADGGLEFGVVYLQRSKQLLVFGELNANRTSVAAVFRSEFPELDAFEVPATFKTDPHVE
jgi:hypothetical protein